MDQPTVEALLTGPTALDCSDWADGDVFLAGGSWLFSEPLPDVRRLRDLTGLGWPSLTVTDGGLEIGATCTLAELAAFEPRPGWSAAHELVRPCCEALLGSFKVWNVATVGGNICLGLPAGPMTSLTAALDGRALLVDRHGATRTLPVTELVRGPRHPALAPGELLRSVFLPLRALTARAVMRRFSLHELGRSATLVIGRLDADGGVVLTVTAATLRPVQLRFDTLPAAADVSAALAAAAPLWHDDVHGDPAWRQALTERFLQEIRDELQGWAELSGTP